MSQAIHQKIASWLTGNFDAATKEEIRSLQANHPDKLEDAFYRNL
jgi:phosphoglucomutase